MIDIERGLISKILQERDVSILSDFKLKSGYFTGDNKTAFLYIQQMLAKTGDVPTERAFKRKLPNYKLDYTRDSEGNKVVGNEEGIKYWVTELRNKVRHNALVDTIEEVATDLQNFDTVEAIEKLKKKILYIETDVEETDAVDITQDVESRISRYKERARTGGMTGIPTGFKSLDTAILGFEKGTLTTFVGSPGTGKTFVEVLIGASLQLQNYRVLHLVTEMSTSLMQDRYDAVLYSKCVGSISYARFKRGALSPKEEEKYFNFLQEDLPSLEPLIIDKVTGVLSVKGAIEKYNPDIVLIDGMYLMTDDLGAREDWQRVTNITRSLKVLAKDTNIPIVINTQVDLKAKGKSLGAIKYSQSTAMDSDNVIFLFREGTMYTDKELGMQILKQREGVLAKIVINWDFDNMNFDDIYLERDDEGGSEDMGGSQANLSDFRKQVAKENKDGN